MSATDLLQIARDTGLRQHLHGLNATDANEALAAFVKALDLQRSKRPDPVDEWNEVRAQARALGKGQSIAKLLAAAHAYGVATATMERALCEAEHQGVVPRSGAGA